MTYRVYDYGRVGADGKPRALHVAKALDVTLRTRPSNMTLAAIWPSVSISPWMPGKGAFADAVDEKSFVSLLITEGEGTLTCGGEAVSVKKGDSYFLPANSGSYTVQGTCQTLVTRV